MAPADKMMQRLAKQRVKSAVERRKRTETAADDAMQKLADEVRSARATGITATDVGALLDPPISRDGVYKLLERWPANGSEA